MQILGENEYSTNPTIGPISYDCVAMTDEFINLVQEFYQNNKDYVLQHAQRVNFVTPPTNAPGINPHGESQNMAYFELQSKSGKKSCYLVDVAGCYYHHDVWAKAFEAETTQEVIDHGIHWLNGALPNSNWKNSGIQKP